MPALAFRGLVSFADHDMSVGTYSSCRIDTGFHLRIGRGHFDLCGGSGRFFLADLI